MRWLILLAPAIKFDMEEFTNGKVAKKSKCRT